jgi:hypothetical protein
MSFEEYLIGNCSPTLASLKTGSLFCAGYTSWEEMQYQLEYWNQALESKGVFLTVLRRSPSRALVYLCRKSHLLRDLQQKDIQAFLKKQGYTDFSLEGALRKLKENMTEKADFPHEIGLFLGYPLEDVEGFLLHGGQNCKCTGCWKVYGNEQHAQKQFARFRKCQQVYRRLWEKGTSIRRLTVAA